jgi:hypothetical protein
MNVEGHQPITARKARPIHYWAIAVILLLFGVVIAEFGPRSAVWSIKAVAVAACALVGVKTLWSAMVAYRVGFVRTRFGDIERASKPAAIWAVILLQALLGPLLIGASMRLTHEW